MMSIHLQVSIRDGSMRLFRQYTRHEMEEPITTQKLDRTAVRERQVGEYMAFHLPDGKEGCEIAVWHDRLVKDGDLLGTCLVRASSVVALSTDMRAVLYIHYALGRYTVVGVDGLKRM